MLMIQAYIVKDTFRGTNLSICRLINNGIWVWPENNQKKMYR